MNDFDEFKSKILYLFDFCGISKFVLMIIGFILCF